MAVKRDCLLKLEWACSHLEDLNKKLFAWRDSNPYTISHEKDTNLPNHFSARISIQPLPHHPFALLIGDIVHNLRGALDHLAYALAAAHTQPFTQDIAEHSEFPIYGDKWSEARYGNDFARKTKGIAPEAQAIIKALQPYQRGKDFASDPLWQIHVLSNIDKHRLLLTAVLNQHAATLVPDRCRNVDFKSLKINVHGGELTDQTEVLRYHALPLDPDREMYVDLHPAINVAFRCGSIVDGKDVVVTLGTIHAYIVGSVFSPLIRFL